MSNNVSRNQNQSLENSNEGSINPTQVDSEIPLNAIKRTHTAKWLSPKIQNMTQEQFQANRMTKSQPATPIGTPLWVSPAYKPKKETNFPSNTDETVAMSHISENSFVNSTASGPFWVSPKKKPTVNNFFTFNNPNTNPLPVDDTKLFSVRSLSDHSVSMNENNTYENSNTEQKDVSDTPCMPRSPSFDLGLFLHKKNSQKALQTQVDLQDDYNDGSPNNENVDRANNYQEAIQLTNIPSNKQPYMELDPQPKPTLFHRSRSRQNQDESNSHSNTQSIPLTQEQQEQTIHNVQENKSNDVLFNSFIQLQQQPMLRWEMQPQAASVSQECSSRTTQQNEAPTRPTSFLPSNPSQPVVFSSRQLSNTSSLSPGSLFPVRTPPGPLSPTNTTPLRPLVAPLSPTALPSARVTSGLLSPTGGARPGVSPVLSTAILLSPTRQPTVPFSPQNQNINDAALANSLQQMEIGALMEEIENSQYLEDPIWGKLIKLSHEKHLTYCQSCLFALCPCFLGQLLEKTGNVYTLCCGFCTVETRIIYSKKSIVFSQLTESYAAILSVVQIVMMIIILFLVDEPPTSPNAWVILESKNWPSILSLFGAKDVFLIVAQNEWWRLISPVFLHGGLVHLFINLTTQLRTGIFLEFYWGWKRWLIIYFGSAVMSTIWSSIFLYERIGVGASGALMGLMGAWFTEILCRYKTKLKEIEHGGMPPPRSQQLGTVTSAIVVTLLLSFAEYVDWAAHVGGMVGGMLWGLVIFGDSLSDIGAGFLCRTFFRIFFFVVLGMMYIVGIFVMLTVHVPTEPLV